MGTFNLPILVTINDVKQPQTDTPFRFVVEVGEYDKEIQIGFKTVDGTAKAQKFAPPGEMTPSGNYWANEGILIWPPYGARTQAIDVNINGSPSIHTNKTFRVVLTNKNGPGVIKIEKDGLGTILADGPPRFYIFDATIAEDTAIFEVRLSDVVNGMTATVHYATEDGTAHAPNRYHSREGVLHFEPGQLIHHVTVPVVINSPNPTSFVMKLSDSQGAPIADGKATATIPAVEIH